MNISCDIIRDLLPMYVDNNVSKASAELVEDHLCECEACTKVLRSMRKNRRPSGRGSFKGGISAKRQLSLLPKAIAVFAVCTVLIGIAAMLFNPIWLTADEAVISVEEAEHGGVKFTLQNYVSGHSVTNWGDNYGHAWRTTRFDKLLSGMGVGIEDYKIVKRTTQEYTIRGAVVNDIGGVESYDSEIADKYGITEMMTEKNHWYENVYTGELDVLLWDAGESAPKVSPIEKEHLMIINFVGAIALTILCPVCILALKKPWARVWLSRVAILTGSVAISTALITGFRFVAVCVQSEPYSTLRWIYLLSVSATLTILSIMQLCKLKKQQKYM